MKRAITIIGIIGATCISIAVFLKLLHWPGANIAMLLGALSLITYACLYMLEQTKVINTGTGKAFAVLFGIGGMLLTGGFLFKQLHWPGANILIITFFATYAALVIVGLIRALGEKDLQLRYKYLNNFILLLGGGLMLLFPTIIAFLN